MLDSDPALGVGAIEGRERRFPGIRGLVALLLVNVVGDGPQLGEVDVVGELGTFRSRPLICAGLCRCQCRYLREYRGKRGLLQSRHS